MNADALHACTSGDPPLQEVDGPVVAGRGVLQRLTPQQVVVQRWEGDVVLPRYFRVMDPSMPVWAIPRVSTPCVW